jgi:hypothetical protein
MDSSSSRRRNRWAAATWILAVGPIAGCATPAGDDGPDARDVADTTDVGDEATETLGPPPSLTGISPAAGPTAGGTPLTLVGENFASGASVTFDGDPAVSTFLVSARRITCRSPAHAAGSVDVVVTNPDGQSSTLAAAFAYDDGAAPEIAWCRLYSPAEMSVAPDAAAGPIYGRILVEEATPGAGQGAGISGQIGVGVAGADPATWTWTDAAYHASVDGDTAGDLANDEYEATLAGRAEGEYRYAYRFSTDDGETWTLCDTNGSTDGFDSARAGVLRVAGTPPPVVGWCALDRPAATTADVGTAAGPLYGRVFVAGVTPGAGAGTGVRGEVGIGAAGSTPGAGWTWTAATYSADVDGTVPADRARDEYAASPPAPSTPGTYAVAYRFSVDDGATWTPCDLDGPGYRPERAGRLEATDPAAGPPVDWCNLQWPSSLRARPGVPTELVFGRVYVDGVTRGAGRGAGVTGQVGYGSTTADPAAWTWVDATYNVDADGIHAGDLANDEYMAALTATAAGTFRYAYRFSRDDGRSWKTCDLDGSDNGFSMDQAGTLVVE